MLGIRADFHFPCKGCVCLSAGPNRPVHQLGRVTFATLPEGAADHHGSHHPTAEASLFLTCPDNLARGVAAIPFCAGPLCEAVQQPLAPLSCWSCRVDTLLPPADSGPDR
jgi:hypothetical protein